MCGMQPLASATPFSRSHTLPPSEMKSLYGSITSSPVMPGAKVMAPSSLGLVRRVRHGVAIGHRRGRRQSDDEGRQVAHLRERRPQRRIACERGDGHHLAARPPVRADVARQRARHPEDEVAHPDVAGIHQPPRRLALLQRPPQKALAHEGAGGMRRKSDEKPTPPTQPALGRRDHCDEHRHVRPPHAAVEPEQARREHPRRFAVQPAQIGRMLALNPLRPPPPGRPLNPCRDEQHEQPPEGQRRTPMARNHAVWPRVLHLVNLACPCSS